MATCRICGTAYDERRYQVVVRELGASFDRIECAELARRRFRRGEEHSASLARALESRLQPARRALEPPATSGV